MKHVIQRMAAVIAEAKERGETLTRAQAREMIADESIAAAQLFGISFTTEMRSMLLRDLERQERLVMAKATLREPAERRAAS